MFLSDRYPQLSLPITRETKDTQGYRDRVLRGEEIPVGERFFLLSGERIFSEKTPAGIAEMLLLPERARFEYCYRALAFHCEPQPIPSTVGAVCIGGLINWEKIRARKSEYLKAGGLNWNEEFKRFTSDKSNYTDSVILLSGGKYSNVSAEKVGLTEELWLEKSITVRKYHELTHFVMRKLFPHNIDTIRDEVLADCIGVYAAFGRCDTKMINEFLGIQNGVFNGRGRLGYYSSPESLAFEAQRAESLLMTYADRLSLLPETPPFEALLQIFSD